MGKDNILRRIRSIDLGSTELPVSPRQETISGNLRDSFVSALEANHVQVQISGSASETQTHLNEALSKVRSYASGIPEVESSADSFNELELYVTRSQLGVAENGAMWISSETQHRVLPFIAEHLIVVIREEELVGDMHEAYRSITDPGGFGVFIAGPSKTADIEQSLVIGAHGAKEMTVILETN